jgi:CubicO group peptidase (beta-lactamase class C family)
MTMAPEAAGDEATFDLAALDGFFGEKLAGPGTGIFAVVQRGDAPAAWRGWGERQIHPGHPWQDPDSLTVPFWIASISKHFTAYAILQLAEAGRLDLDAAACKYLSRLARVSEQVTVRNLLDSRSGLQHDEHCVVLCGSTPEAGLTFRRRLDFIYEKSHLDVPPDTQTFYQSTDFTLLGEIVEAVTGSTLDGYARDSIFRPIGMNDTFYGLHYGEVYPRMAGTYCKSSDGTLRQYHNNMEVLGDGSVVSTAADLLTWHQHLRRDDLAQQWFEGFGAFREDAGGKGLMYGCGTNRFSVRGAAAYGKGGHSYAHTAGFVRVPELDLFIAVFSNQPLLSGLGLAADVADWAAECLGSKASIAAAPMPAELKGLWVNRDNAYVVEIIGSERDSPCGRVPVRALRFGAARASLHSAGPGRMKSWGHYEYDLQYDERGLMIAFGKNPPGVYARCYPEPVPADQVGELAGRYLCPILDGLVRIREEEGAAVLQWGPGHAAAQVLPLYRTAPDCYLATLAPLRGQSFDDGGQSRYAGAQTYYIKAQREADGRVAALTISNCHVRNYTYHRLPEQRDGACAPEG